MKAKIILTTLAVATALSQMGFAATDNTKWDLPISKGFQSIEKKDETTVKNVNLMMAHLSFAAQAIDLKLKKPALENLEQAVKLCATLEKSRPEAISKYDFKYGKATSVIGGLTRNYYLPVADDIFVDERFDEKSIWRKNPVVEVKGLAIVHSNLKLNLQDVVTSINSATKLTKSDKFDEAGTALDGVYKNAISNEEVVTNPVWTVWGNLNLAQAFLKGGQFKNARFALSSAKSDIQQLEKSKVLTKSGAEAKDLQSEIEKIEHTLNEKDPSMVKKIQAKLSHWGAKVKGWL